jgi:glutathione S-transferase/RNA polymerase-associated protein
MLILYEHPLSPYAQKNKIALREKGVEFELRLPSGIGSGAAADPGFLSASPRFEVPALLDSDDAAIRIFDSTIILEYLEDRFPNPPLLPSSPIERARARMIEDVMDTHYEAINWGLSEIHNFGRATGDLKAAMVERAEQQTRRLQSWLEAELAGKEWFGDIRFGWADLSVVPYLNGSSGFGLAPEPDSPLGAWFERANQRTSVAETTREAVEVAAQMSGVAELVEKGLFKRHYRDHRLEWMIRTGGVEIVLEGIERDNVRFTEFPPRG